MPSLQLLNVAHDGFSDVIHRLKPFGGVVKVYPDDMNLYSNEVKVYPNEVNSYPNEGKCIPMT